MDILDYEMVNVVLYVGSNLLNYECIANFVITSPKVSDQKPVIRLDKTPGSVRVWCNLGPDRMPKIETWTRTKPGFCMSDPGLSPACPGSGFYLPGF